jgi:hypothetical protein
MKPVRIKNKGVIMFLEIQISLGKEYKGWCKKYGKDFTDASISNELQLTADNLNDDVFEGHKTIYPELFNQRGHK